jgi:ABC-2 type transport system permease protein
MSTFNRWTALIKREVIEHRRMVVYAPIVVAIVICLGLVASIIFNGVMTINGQSVNNIKLLGGKLVDAKIDGLDIAKFHSGLFLGFYTIFHAVCALTCYYFALSSLFDERKDRSTLWWRSLPVRDWETVSAKVAMIVLVIPAFALAALFVTQLVIWLIMGLIAWRHGFDPWTLVFAGANMPRIMIWEVASQLLSSLWVLPVFAWCLLCSAFSKQRPILYAVFIPALGAFLLLMINLTKIITIWTDPHLSVTRLLTLYFKRAVDAFVPLGAVMEKKPELLSFGRMGEIATSQSFIVGLVVAAAFIGSAMWVRRYREDTAL